MDNTERPSEPIERPHKAMWREANVRLVPSAILFIAGIVVASYHGGVRTGDFGHKLFAVIAIVVFASFALAFVQTLTKTVGRIIYKYGFTRGRVAAFQFVSRLIGYVSIFLAALDLLGIPVGKLLLGGAALGIILGVAAQQALANFFASIVLIISSPFSVGDDVTITAGAMGGQYTGRIKDIGLTHTKLKDEEGNIILLPNAAILSGATIKAKRPPRRA